MVLKRKVKGTIATVFVMASLCFGQAASAQEAPASPTEAQQQQTQDFSDSDLNKFVQANAKAMSIQKKRQAEMMAVIEEEKLTIDKFNEMAQALQQQKLQEVGATQEEMAAFDKAAQKIMEMQPQVRQEVQEAIEEEIPVDKFEKIMLAYEQNPAVQAKVNQILQKQEQ